jgi:hypothetical protein
LRPALPAGGERRGKRNQHRNNRLSHLGTSHSRYSSPTRALRLSRFKHAVLLIGKTVVPSTVDIFSRVDPKSVDPQLLNAARRTALA